MRLLLLDVNEKVEDLSPPKDNSPSFGKAAQ